MAEDRELTAADVAGKLKDAKVRVHKRDKDGNPARDKDGAFRVEERAPTAADILSFRQAEDGSVSVVTIDGQKLTA